MKKRLLSALLAVLTVLSVFSITAVAANNPSTLMNDAPSYVALDTAVANIWTGEATAKTEELSQVTFWLHITDVTEPIYLVGMRFGFTTDDGTAFGTHGTGSTNLQNNGLLITEGGDYLISATLGSSNLAWNYKADNGSFASFTSFGAAAYDAAAYDADGTLKKTSAKAALMGIIEGEPAYDRQITFSANGALLGISAQTYETLTAKGFNYNNNPNLYTDKNLSFKKAVIPYSAPELEGMSFTSWTDADGNRTISLVSDMINANYALLETAYTASASSEAAGSTGKLTLKVADTDLGITFGSVNVAYDTEKFTFYADTDKNGVVTVNYSKVAADGTVGKLVYKIADGIAANADLTLTGSANVGSTAIIVTENITTVNIASILNAGVQNINKNTVDEVGNTVLPEEQRLWTGEVALDNTDGFTFVYKVDGIDTPINLANFAAGYKKVKDGSIIHQYNSASAEWWWQKSGHYDFSFTEDGYFYMYLNRILFGNSDLAAATDLVAFSDVSALADNYVNRNNENENATFTMLAVYADNMEVTVNYRNLDGTIIASVPYMYTDISGALDPAEGKIVGKLASAADIFTAGGVSAPTLDCYELAGWADINGNAVTAVYTDCEVYPVWKLSEDAKDHTFTNYTSNGDAACTADGTKTAVCDKCAKATDTVADEGSVTAHVYQWTVTTQPTNTTEGTETGVCICGDMITRPVACLVPNDINGDGSLNIIDAEIIARYIAQNGESGIWDLTSCNLLTADRNGDGTVSQLDLSIIISEIAAA